MRLALHSNLSTFKGHSHSINCKCDTIPVFGTNARKTALNKSHRLDPTRSLTLRQKWEADMNRRFKQLRRNIKTSIIDNDALGLNQNIKQFKFNAPIPSKQFVFNTSAEKLAGYNKWLQSEIDSGILEVVSRDGAIITDHSQWQNGYIDSAFKKGIQRGEQELAKKGITVPKQPGARIFDAPFLGPIRQERVQLIYARVFEELKGITDAMSQQMSRSLAESLAEGRGPYQTARILMNRVERYGTLAMTDSSGRFVSALQRARTLARTETIRAHHAGTIMAYKEAGVENVKILAEWNAAGFNVCPDCAGLNGRIFSLREIEGLIPLHPNCRCIALPAGIGEDPKGRGKFDKSSIGKQYKRKDGKVQKKRGYYRQKTGKTTPPPRSVK